MGSPQPSTDLNVGVSRDAQRQYGLIRPHHVFPEPATFAVLTASGMVTTYHRAGLKKARELGSRFVRSLATAQLENEHE
jgi:hypothetical protein